MPYKLAFAGLYFHVQCLLDRENERLRLVGIADRTYPADSIFHNPGLDPGEVAKQKGVPLYDDPGGLLDEQDPDILAVYGVDSAKAGIIVEALQRGIHVIADKPPCISLEQLEAIRQAHAKSSGSLAILFPFPYYPLARRLGELVSSGKLGDPVMIRTRRAYIQKVATRPKWFFTKEHGGGILCDIGTHDLDLVRFITGCDALSVSAIAGNGRIPDYATGEDHAAAIFSMDGNLAYTVQIDRLSASTVTGDQSSIEIFGTEGQAIVPRGFDRIEVTIEGKETETETGFAPCSYEPLVDDYLANLDAGETEAHFFAPQVLNSVKGMLAAQASADEGGCRIDI